jgi:hypothetical protein
MHHLWLVPAVPLALFGSGLGLILCDIKPAYSQNIRTRLPAGGYAPPIAHTSACLPPSDPGYSPAR